MWNTEWQAISARIAGLVGAGTFFLQTKENDDYFVSDDLIQNATRVAADVVLFRDRYANLLPPHAQVCLGNFIGPTTVVSSFCRPTRSHLCQAASAV